MDVVKKDVCIGCGACVASCPYASIAIKNEVPQLVAVCYACGVCYQQCPRLLKETAALEKSLFGRERKAEESLGVYRAVYTARAKDADILKVGQDGGAVSAIIKGLLGRQLFDCAVLCSSEKADIWRPDPAVVSRADAVKEYAGTKYTPGGMLVGLQSAVEEHMKGSVVLVGRPCELWATRIYQSAPFGCLKLGERAKLTIGLFCMEAFRYDKLVASYLKEARGIDPSSISKMSISKGKFIVHVKGEKVLEEPLKEVKIHALKGCELCPDLTAELADISVGSIGSPDGWSTVLVRTEQGEKFFKEIAGELEFKEVDAQSLALLEKLTNRKRSGAVKLEDLLKPPQGPQVVASSGSQ